MASRKRIVICYILLQASFWGMLSSICAYQAAVVLDRGFTAGQAGIFCALCYFASLFTQPVIGGWADRHPEVPLKRLLIAKQMLSTGISPGVVYSNCGFSDYANFYRAFKTQYGVSPSDCADNGGS